MSSNTITPTKGQGTPMPNEEQNSPQEANQAGSASQNEQQTVSSATPADPPADPIDRNFSIDIAPGADGQILSVNLPVFLTRHMHDPAKYILLRQALDKVFRVFFSSDEGIKPEAPIETYMAYKALEISFQKVFEWAAQKTLGALPDLPVVVLVDIEENPYQPEAYEIFMNDPTNNTDVAGLQKWVKTLQSMLISTNATINGQRREISYLERIRTNQEEQIDKLQDQLQAYGQLVAKLQQQTEMVVARAKNNDVLIAPKVDAGMTVELYLNVTGIEGSPEIDVVKRALVQYRDERLEQAMLGIRNDDAEGAFFEYRDYEMLQDILDNLSDSLVDLSEKNHRAKVCVENPSRYAEWYDGIKTRGNKERLAFVEKYSHDYDKEKEAVVEETSLNSDDEEADLKKYEEELVEGLSEQDKDLVWYMADKKGMSEERLQRFVNMLREKAAKEQESPVE
jgi:hypothetical protein